MRAARLSARGSVVALVAAVSACGPGAGSSQNVTSSHTSSTAPPALVAVLDKPFGAVTNTLRLLHLNGEEVANTPLRDSDEAVTLAGQRALIAGAGTIRALDASGQVRDVETYSTPADALVNDIIGSEDGRQWLFTSVRQAGSGDVETRVLLGSEGAPPRQLLDRTVAGRALAALAWTRGGPVVSDEPVGIGGYILFRRGYGDTLEVDTTRGTLVPLEPSTCALSDLGNDGTRVCVSGGHEAPHGNEPVVLHVTRAGTEVLSLPFPSSIAQAGAALLSPDGTRVTVADSPATGNPPEQISAAVVDLRNGAQRSLPAGLRPVGWTNDGRIVATRDQGVGGGDPGTYLAGQDEAVSVVSASPYAVGVSG